MAERVTERVDVLVVGAGPVGLMLAAEIALAGVRPVVVERRDAPDPEPRARGVGPLAVEALRRRGLGPAIDAHHAAGLADWVAMHGSANAHFAQLHGFAFPPQRDRVFIWQPQLEDVLARHTAELGVGVRREQSLTRLTQDTGGVAATIRTPHGDRVVEAAYLVGADGGRSTVRRLAGFAFPGTPPTSVHRSGKVELADPDDLPEAGQYEGGTLLSGPGRLGTVEFGSAAQDTHGNGPLDVAELTDSVERVTGRRIAISALHSALRFTDAARQVTSYRDGRVLLCGDAAHVHSPNGGQGLDLGLMDAVNLGWKLAATVAGTAPPGLLDTYTRERHPFGAAVLQNTMAQAALLTPGPHVEALRRVVSDLMSIEGVKDYFVELMTRLHQRLPVPGVVDEADPGATGQQTGGLDDPIGRHVPDFPVVSDGVDTTVYALAATGRHLLVHRAGCAAIASAADGATDRVRPVPTSAAMPADTVGLLIRPDGVVAWSATAAGCDDLTRLDAALSAVPGGGVSQARDSR